MKPICKPCQRFFRPKKNGYKFIEGMPHGHELALPGKADPARWTPYKLWIGDLWWCPDCGAEIIVGVAHSPISEHYQSNFQANLPLHEQLQINDC